MKDQYRAGDLEKLCGLVNVNYENYEKLYKVIALSTAAGIVAGRKENLAKEINVTCNCNGPFAGDGRCSCFKLNKNCTSHCHKKSKGKLTCKNSDKKSK